MDSSTFRQLMGHFATGVTVVTTNVDNRYHGMTANAFSSVSLDPPLVLVCVDRQATCHQQIERAAAFGINFLRDDQAEVSTSFAQSSEPERESLAGYPFEMSEDGIPLLRDSLARMTCTLEHAHEGGDHTIFVGRVTSAKVSGHRRPLIYYDGAYTELREPVREEEE